MDCLAQTGMIFNIQHFSMHDGPGIRTIVFFKGCPLRCLWCSNPESQSRSRQLGYNAANCLHCRLCVQTCSRKALEQGDNGIVIGSQCIPQEGDCAKVCPGEALIRYGEEKNVAEILEEVERDAPFYRDRGGLTLSGGEPLAQPDFALALLEAARARGISAAMETCGFVGREIFIRAAGLLDYMLCDIKLLDDEKHNNATGAPVTPILNNLAAVRQRWPDLPLHIRTPVIPGVNDTEQDIRAIADFTREIGATRYELLPYHRLGQQKYKYLGREYPLDPDLKADMACFDRLCAIAELAGAPVV